MALFMDEARMENALRNEAFPALERLARNPSMRDRDLNRFNDDAPPPYESSTEEDEALPIPGPITIPDDVQEKIDRPLNDSERQRLARNTQSVYNPGKRYHEEMAHELERLQTWAEDDANPEVRDYFIRKESAKEGRVGHQRLNIIARRNIRRRWQKLGVWNSEWGIPANQAWGFTDPREPQDKDDSWTWTWRWQKTKEVDDLSDHPISRAVELRQGLRRGQHVPGPPRSNLPPNASTSQAESFIASRPWVIYRLEAAEEIPRRSRLLSPAPHRKYYYKYKHRDVKQSWKERGDWKDEWSLPKRKPIVGWKWRHESPSPEPENLSQLNDMADWELSPSEADALEAAVPTSPVTDPLRWPPLNWSLPQEAAASDAVDGNAGGNENSDCSALPAPPPSPPAHPEPRARRRAALVADAPPPPLRRSARIAAMANPAKKAIAPPVQPPSPLRRVRQQANQRQQKQQRAQKTKPTKKTIRAATRAATRTATRTATRAAKKARKKAADKPKTSQRRKAESAPEASKPRTRRRRRT